MIEKWNRFWFEQIPPHAYAVLRIAFGLLGCWATYQLRDFAVFWSPDGLVPADGFAWKTELVRVGLGDLTAALLLVTTGAAYVCMLLGYRTTLAVPLCFVMALVQPQWNYLPLLAAFYVVRAILFCLLWVDSGAVWSLDARHRARHDATPLVANSFQPIWPLRLIRFQIAIIYLSSGIAKLFGNAWLDGSALSHVLSSNQFQRFPTDLPLGLQGASVVATYFVLFWELLFAPALLHPFTRRLVIGLGVLIHLSMWVFLELGPFSWVMMASYLAFMNPHRMPSLLMKAHTIRRVASP